MWHTLRGGLDVALRWVDIRRKHSREFLVNLTNPEWDFNEEQVTHAEKKSA
jgi:hypothetical protein